MIVLKFAGTSVEDARSMKNAMRLVKREYLANQSLWYGDKLGRFCPISR